MESSVSWFSGKRVLVTGGSSGIGLAAAHQLARQGARLLLVARDPSKLEAARQAVASSHPDGENAVDILSLDLGDRTAIREELGKLQDPLFDVLINNAGITRPGNFLELPEKCFDDMLAVNYLGAMELTRQLLPPMMEARGGRIAFVSSLLGLMGIWGYSAYAASKFAVRGFAECLRCELKPYDIRVTVCYPPDTDTPQHENEKPFLPPETVAQAGTAGLLSADHVARILLEGIVKGKFNVVPGAQARFAEVANRLAPTVVHAVLDYDAGKVRRK